MNLYRRRERQGKLWAATLLVVVLFALDVLSGGRVRALVHQGAASLTRLFGGAASSVARSGFFSSRASLESQNRSLSQQLTTYQVRDALASAVRDENDQLRALVHVAEQNAGLTASVASSVIASPYGTFLIDAGSADGISTGALVLTGGSGVHDSVVVGTVTSVSSHTATVTETFAPSASVHAIIHANAVTLDGSGGGNAHAQLPRDATVQVGDIVTSPDLGGRAIGIVGQVVSTPAQAEQDVYVRVPVNLGSLQYVYVVTS